MIFKRNKKYCAVLTEMKRGYWVDSCPLFISKEKGLFPVYKTGGPTGRYPKNNQEFILKKLEEK